MMPVGTVIRMKKRVQRKMVRRKHLNGTRVRAVARGRLLSLDQRASPAVQLHFLVLGKIWGHCTHSESFEEDQTD